MACMENKERLKMLSILRLASRMSEGFRVEIWAIHLLHEVKLWKHTQRIFTIHSEVFCDSFSSIERNSSHTQKQALQKLCLNA